MFMLPMAVAISMQSLSAGEPEYGMEKYTPREGALTIPLIFLIHLL